MAGNGKSKMAETTASKRSDAADVADVATTEKTQKAVKKVQKDASSEEEENDEDEDSEDEAEPLQLDIDNFGRPHGVVGTLDYSFRSLHKALRVPDDKNYVQLVQDCETAFTAREIENAEYSTGTTFFLPANMEPRCLLERMARDVFDFHTRDVKEFNRDKSGAEWWTLVLDAGETMDDVAFHWDRDYGLEDQYRVNLHPHVGTVTYLSDIGGPTVVLEKISPVQTGSDECGAGEISVGYVSRPVMGKHISFDGRLLHGAPGDLAKVFTDAAAPSGDKAVAGDKRKREAMAIQNGRRVTFLVNVWLNHKPIDSDPFPEDDLAKLACSVKDGIKFALEEAEENQTHDDEIREVKCESGGKDTMTTLDLSFVEANHRMSLLLPIPVAKLQDEVLKTPLASSFEVVFPADNKAQLVAGDEVDDEEDDEDEEDDSEGDDEEDDE